MTIAIRIARASSGRDKVLFSGYHGWNDWYLAANLQSGDGLDQHLIPGLSTKGVPSGLKNTAIPFLYNDPNDFEKVLAHNEDAGVICIEGARYDLPSSPFLQKVTDAARRYNMVIVSDEITSGFRLTDGGVYKINGFRPDIVVYAKALGGGYPISAILGTDEVMYAAQDTFMSSTMWTERVGFAAALATLNIITREKVWEHLVKIGGLIGEGWAKLAKKHGLNISVTEVKPLITMKFDYGNLNQVLVTLFTQEMLKRGYLSATSVYVSYAHDEAIVEGYLEAVDDCFSVLMQGLEKGRVEELLNTRTRSDSFSRLTP